MVHSKNYSLELKEKDYYANCNKTYTESVSDFLLWVNNIYDAPEENIYGHDLSFRPDLVYYRGQSCSCWKLNPSVSCDNPLAIQP